MARPCKNKDEIKNVSYRIRLTEKDYKKLQEFSHNNKQTMSKTIREALYYYMAAKE